MINAQDKFWCGNIAGSVTRTVEGMEGGLSSPQLRQPIYSNESACVTLRATASRDTGAGKPPLRDCTISAGVT